MVSEDSNTERVPADDPQVDAVVDDAQETAVTEDSQDDGVAQTATKDDADSLADKSQEDVAADDDAQETADDDDADGSADGADADTDDANAADADDVDDADAKDADDDAADDDATDTDADAADTDADATDADTDDAADADAADTETDSADTKDADDNAADNDADAETDTADADAKPAITAAAALKKHALIKKAAIVLAAALLIVIAGCCVALAIDDNSRTQLVPEKTTLDGQVDVSNMTENELYDLVVSRADEGLSTIVSLDIAGTVYPIDLREVGTLAPQDTVAQAYAPYNAFFLVRWGGRIGELITKDTGSYDIHTTCEVDHNALKARVEEIASQANHDPKDAGYEFESESRRLVTSPPVDGVVVDVDATVARIEKAASSNDPLPERYQVEAVVTLTAPGVLESGQAILVDTRECRVRLYEAGEEVASYACTPGQSGYATPKGDWHLEYKDPSPVWINPHSEWSESMPDTIAPGASNPLGLRALAVSCGGGIYIHGTTNTGGLGYPGSHGCIRLSNSNIVELYDRVSAGIPIIIR